MADTLRIVTIGDDGRARVLEDLQVADTIYRERDTLAITPGAAAPRTASSPTRYGGEQTVGLKQGNGGIAATLMVKATTAPAAAAIVERLLARVATARRDLYIEWRPEGLTFSTYSRITGPGTSSPTYRALEWQGARRIAVPVAWPVEPLPRGLPVSVYERFVPPADKSNGTVNLLPDPNGGSSASVYPTAGATGTTITTADPGTHDLELGGLNRGRYIALSGASSAGNTELVDAASATNPNRCAVIPGAYYAVRVRFKVRTAWTNAPSGIYPVARFEAAGSNNPILLNPSALLNTIANGTVVDLAQIVQAPAGMKTLSVGLRVAGSANIAGAVRFGQFMVARVDGPSSPIPAYGDGEGPLYRWAGAEFLSPSIELQESDLADYTRLGAIASVERTSRSGLWQAFTAEASGSLVHTAREAVPDGEVIVSGIFRTAGSAGYRHFLTPGIKYRADDGRYIWATIDGGNFVMYSFDGASDAQLTQAALTTPPTVATEYRYYMALRSEGDAIIAEWYAGTVPNADRSNYVQRLWFFLDDTTNATAAAMGASRSGSPMARARGMSAGGVAQLTSFDYRPYMFADQKLPDVIPLRKLPGTAPALLSPSIGFPGGANIPAAMESGDHDFGLFAWRNKVGRSNLFTNGDGRRRGGWTAIAGGTLNEEWGVGPTGGFAAGSPPDLTTSARIVANPAGTNSGGTIFETRRTFKRGQAYTVEFWYYVNGAIGTSWALTLNADYSVTGWGGTINAVLDATATLSQWKKCVYTFRPQQNIGRVAIRALHAASGAGGRELYLAGAELYEGTPADAPIEREHTSGRGAVAPFGILQAENTIDVVEVLSTTDAANLTNGTRLDFASNGTGTVRNAEYWIDPLLIAPADFAGDTIDVQVFALAVVDANIPLGGTAVVSARHEADTEGTARVYTREFGAAGRNLLTATQATKAGTCVLLGTLTLGTRGGRYVMRVGVGSGATAARVVGLDSFVIVPLGRVVSSPTGKSLVNYPVFAPWQWRSSPSVATISHERRVEPDGSARTILTDGTSYPYGSLGGEPIELDPKAGDGELLAWTYPAAPGGFSPGGNAVGGWVGSGPTVAVRCDVIPRYRLMSA